VLDLQELCHSGHFDLADNVLLHVVEAGVARAEDQVLAFLGDAQVALSHSRLQVEDHCLVLGAKVLHEDNDILNEEDFNDIILTDLGNVSW